MKEVVLHLDDKSHPIDLHIDSAESRPVSAFILLANVPSDPPGAVILTFGNSNAVGNLLMTLYQRSVHENPDMAWVVEQVSRGIVSFADAERGRWPTDGREGRA